MPTFIFGGILPKTLFTAKKIEPSMNATSSHVPTAKSGWLPKKKLGTLDAKKKVWHDPCQK
jgi:hypothetical protein